uniref:NgoPII family restriction endonuclease n=1 Tax=Streptococcus pneumoniae TaxID=1313 RepID=UPI00115218CA
LIDASVYCADKIVYQDIFEKIKYGISSIPNVNFSPTQELGRVNKIDLVIIKTLTIFPKDKLTRIPGNDFKSSAH